MKHQAGFTLVEIAIVLVIIGLLLGGVLKGKEIITNAKVVNLESNFTGISSAIYSYQDRYRAWPGDDIDASRFANVGGTKVGDNDGNISGQFDSTTDSDESRLFWLHLRNANLVTGDPTTYEQPPNPFNGIIGCSSEALTGGTINDIYIGFSNIPGDIAQILESRSDDGLPDKGGIQAIKKGETSVASGYNQEDKYDMFFEL